MKAHQDLAEQQARLAERERVARPAPAFQVPAPLSDLTAAAESAGRWNLGRLEQLVAEHDDEFPARVDEWRSYLYFLQAHADASGNLPSRFDWLVEDTFRELLERVTLLTKS